MMSLRKNLGIYFEEIDHPIGITINLIILILIFLSLVVFVAETYSLPEEFLSWLHLIDLVILIVFSIEYLLRFWCAENQLKFVFSLFSFIDLIAIIPLLFGFFDVRFVRIFRWFRLLRIFRFFKFETFIFNIKTEDKIPLLRILLTLFSIVFIYSGLIYQVEHQVNPKIFRNFFDALYFSIVTMTTVGFGDITPLSENGRWLTLLMIITGVILIPWQVSELLKELLKNADTVQKVCSGCGLSVHDTDANYCKICGEKLNSIAIDNGELKKPRIRENEELSQQK